MGKAAVQENGGVVGWFTTWTRAEWRSLLVALAISLLAHALLLTTARPHREGDGLQPVLTVRLTGAFVAPRPAEVPVAAATSSPPAAIPALPQPKKEPETAQAMHVAPAPPAPAVAPAKVEAVPAIARPVPQQPVTRPEPEQSARAADEVRAAAPTLAPSQPASPLSTPDVGDLGRTLLGRRLQARLWVAPDGTVTQAEVRRNEISPEVARSLEQALATMRFAPAQQDGAPVPTVLDTRVCFDNAGLLATLDAECLQVPSPTTPATAR